MSDAVLFLCPRCGAARELPSYAIANRVRCLKCLTSSRSAGLLYGPTDWDKVPSFTTLAALAAARERRPTERQWRLIACGIARTDFDWLRNPWFRDALAGAEHWADAGAPPRDLATCRQQLQRLDRSEQERDPYEWLRNPEDTERQRQERRLPYGWVFLALRALSDDPRLRADDLTLDTRTTATAVFREVLPNPFVTVNWSPEWFTGTVRDLAAHITAKREFGAMPILADALQDAGCDAEPVLAHCRANKPHARGCWVLDAILGRA